MCADVKRVRQYDSSSRQEQAKRNRSTILEAARRLFLDRGFAATTMPDIASAAGVSVQTVYKVFRNKPGLAKAVFDVAIAGDDEPVPLLQRERLIRVRNEPDPRRRFQLYGEHLAAVAPRHVPIQLVILAAAATDPEAGKVWDQLQAERLTGMSLFARSLHGEGHLRVWHFREPRRATCSGPTTPQNSSSCSSSSGAGRPDGTANGSPMRSALRCSREMK